MASLPTTPQDYRDRATDCERVAQEAVSQETREIMVYLAERWRVLADEVEAQPGAGRPRSIPLAE